MPHRRQRQVRASVGHACQVKLAGLCLRPPENPSRQQDCPLLDGRPRGRPAGRGSPHLCRPAPQRGGVAGQQPPQRLGSQYARRTRQQRHCPGVLQREERLAAWRVAGVGFQPRRHEVGERPAAPVLQQRPSSRRREQHALRGCPSQPLYAGQPAAERVGVPGKAQHAGQGVQDSQRRPCSGYTAHRRGSVATHREQVQPALRRHAGGPECGVAGTARIGFDQRGCGGGPILQRGSVRLRQALPGLVQHGGQGVPVPDQVVQARRQAVWRGGKLRRHAPRAAIAASSASWISGSSVIGSTIPARKASRSPTPPATSRPA